MVWIVVGVGGKSVLWGVGLTRSQGLTRFTESSGMVFLFRG